MTEIKVHEKSGTKGFTAYDSITNQIVLAFGSTSNF